VAAAREALANAARHSGADRIDLYAEVAAGTAEVFVRDRGRGFDPDTVPLDRLGVRGSIVDRMARHGGSATIRTAPGQGTEVRLRMADIGSSGDEGSPPPPDTGHDDEGNVG
jgi:signal transduction histidine kinase